MQALGLGNALLLVDAGENHAIGEAETGDEIGREDFAAQRVGAGFEHSPDASPRINGTQCPEGFADGGGVVGEVLDERDAVDLGRALRGGA